MATRLMAASVQSWWIERISFKIRRTIEFSVLHTIFVSEHAFGPFLET